MADTETIHRYDVRVDKDLTQLEVVACFDGQVPGVLHAGSRRATGFLQSVAVRDDTGEGTIRRRQSRLFTSSIPESACIDYVVEMNADDLDDRTNRFTDSFRHVGADITAPPALWLWRPENLGPDEDIEVAFDLPENVAVSTPWRLIWRDNETSIYRVGHGSMYWSAVVAFGHFDVQEIQVAGGRIRLAVLDGNPRAQINTARQWVRHAAGAVASVSGSFPVPEAQMLLVPVAIGSNPIYSPFNDEEQADPFPFAMITRGGQSAGIFFIDQRLPVSDFVNDWVAVHELSHMLHPFMGNSGAWLSEGIASYYQQILRARTGILTAPEAWLALHKGFLRGLDGWSGLTLTEASRQRRKHNTYMQIYWSGAAIAFIADVELRRRTDGNESLDTALGRFQECCLPADKRWGAREFMQKLDALVDTDIFIDLYEQYAESTEFPDFAPAYEYLGIVAAPESIELTDTPYAGHRDEIMSAGRPAAVN